MSEEQHVALVTGYTGESGKALLKELVQNRQFKKIILVGRRQVEYNESEYKEKTVGIYSSPVTAAHAYFYLGTTRNRFRENRRAC